MSEQAPVALQQGQQPDSYIQDHPNAIEDPAKAEIMAHASKEQEEAVVKARAEALGHAALISGGGYNTAEYDGRKAAERAVQARKEANTRANQAAAIYDSVKNL